LSSLDKSITDPGTLTDEASRDAFYQLMISVRRTLIAAIEELQLTLDSGTYFTVPERRDDRADEEATAANWELDMAELERQLQQTDAEYRRAVQARHERRLSEEDEAE
jgi:hypothetical protein